MSAYTDEERERIMREARANIERDFGKPPETGGFPPAATPTGWRASAGETLATSGHAIGQRLGLHAPVGEPQPEPPRRTLDAEEADAMIALRIGEAIGAEREHLRELLVGLVAAIRDEADAALAEMKAISASRETRVVALCEQLHALRVENANARADIAELRMALRSVGAERTLDLPNPLSRRIQVN